MVSLTLPGLYLQLCSYVVSTDNNSHDFVTTIAKLLLGLY